MILNDVLDRIEKKYPLHLQYSWDNSGLNIGDRKQNIEKVLLTLEVTEKTVDEAIEKDVDLIISHHPFMFSKTNRIIKDDIKGGIIYKLIANSISVYCMHTSYDIAFDGLNDYFMKLIDAEDVYVFEEEGSEESYEGGRKYGLGRVGKLKKTVTSGEMIEILKKKLNIDSVRYIGDENRKISTVAVVTGSGAEFFEGLAQKGIDALITGDMKYHQAMDAISEGATVIDCGHYGSEHIFADSIIDFLKKEMPEMKIEISENIIDPFKVV